MRAVAIAMVVGATAVLLPGRIAAAQTLRPDVLEPVAAIGVEMGDPKLEFGTIVSMAVDDTRGVLFLLDPLKARLSAFSRSGRFIDAVGRRGSGPGEFGAATALMFDGANLHVLDQRNLRITTYGLRGDSFELTAEVRLPFQVVGACVLNQTVFLLGYHRGSMVHRFDLQKRQVTGSFGLPFHEGDAAMAALTAWGLIFCDAASNSVYVPPTSVPTVRRYSPAGELMWESEVPGMAPSTVRRSASGVTWTRPKDRENPHTMISLSTLRSGQLLVQYGEVAWRTGVPEDAVDVRSVVYDVRSGLRLTTQDDLPRIDVASGKFAYSRANDPFPRIIIYAWR